MSAIGLLLGMQIGSGAPAEARAPHEMRAVRRVCGLSCLWQLLGDAVSGLRSALQPSPCFPDPRLFSRPVDASHDPIDVALEYCEYAQKVETTPATSMRQVTTGGSADTHVDAMAAGTWRSLSRYTHVPLAAPHTPVLFAPLSAPASHASAANVPFILPTRRYM